MMTLFPEHVADRFGTLLKARVLDLKEFNLLTSIWMRHMPDAFSTQADLAASQAMGNISKLFRDELMDHAKEISPMLDEFADAYSLRKLDPLRLGSIAGWLSPLCMLRRLSQSA